MKKLLIALLALTLISTAEAKRLVAIMTADSFGMVNVETIENTFSGAISIVETMPGIYRLVSDNNEFTVGRTTMFSVLMPSYYVYSEYISDDRIDIYELDGFNGNLTYGNSITVRIDAD